MRISIGRGSHDLEKRMDGQGITRRDFLKFCTAVAATMGLEASFAGKVAAALTDEKRPSVVYLHNAECTGCSEALLRITHPNLEELIFDTVSLEYHETIMAAAGEAAEKALMDAVNDPNGFVCVVEGAIPTAMGGLYGQIGGKTMYDICKEILPKAKAVISYGTCAAFGGVQAAAPNLTGAKGIGDCFKDLGINTINVTGCPPNPMNLIATIVKYLMGEKIELDDHNRPVDFFGKTVHEQCERLVHFEAGEFAPSFDSDEARRGFCLYELGCKGPETYNNCPTAKFNGVSWPVAAGHPCIGCSEPGFWDEFGPFYN